MGDVRVDHLKYIFAFCCRTEEFEMMHAGEQSKPLTIFDGPGITFIPVPEKREVVKRSASVYLEKAGVLGSMLT